MPALPPLSSVSTPSPSNIENNNVNFVIDVPQENAQVNIVAAYADNLSASPNTVGNM
jgi:hypothetical protein